MRYESFIAALLGLCSNEDVERVRSQVDRCFSGFQAAARAVRESGLADVLSAYGAACQQALASALGAERLDPAILRELAQRFEDMQTPPATVYLPAPVPPRRRTGFRRDEDE